MAKQKSSSKQFKALRQEIKLFGTQIDFKFESLVTQLKIMLHDSLGDLKSGAKTQLQKIDSSKTSDDTILDGKTLTLPETPQDEILKISFGKTDNSQEKTSRIQFQLLFDYSSDSFQPENSIDQQQKRVEEEDETITTVSKMRNKTSRDNLIFLKSVDNMNISHQEVFQYTKLDWKRYRKK